MKKLTALIASAFLISSASTIYAEDSLTVSIKRLTMESANKIATEAMLACRKMGIQVTATVVDKHGLVQALARDTLAPHVSLRISKMKAYTAANFTANTSQLKRQSESPIGRVPGLVMSDGAVIISAGGIVYGAVGVSGAPSGTTDEQCAQAGLDAILEDLEMAD
ncbi:MAG: heme-binding protein [Gammaproteobacteria bacterium]|nr:heme-binding protein [Gammaproteobacteria bacterium]